MRATTILLPGLAAAALGVSACGGGGEASGEQPASARDRAFDGALKFARCMRGEGLDFPDPQRAGNGLIKIGGPGRGKIRPDDPRIQAAQRKCGKYLEQGGGEPPDAATQAKMRDAFVAYARCMRGEGVDMPDPKPGQPGLVFRRGGGEASGPDPESPAFQAADRKCHSHLAAIDAAVQGERSR